MSNYNLRLVIVCIVSVMANTASVGSAGLWSALNPFKQRVEADPNKSYLLKDENGPWMILATTFAGPEAEREARELVLELRKEFNLTAYLHKKRFDYSEPVVGRGLNRFGGPKKMRYRQKLAFDEWAVLIGNFDSIEHPAIERTLSNIKYARPVCLGSTTTQRYRGIREFQKLVNGDRAKSEKGPMGNAFVTRNPLLPQEFFTPSGIDKFVYELNKDLEYSLLECPDKYTVRVATFRGAVVVDQRRVDEITKGGDMDTRLAEAAMKADTMTRALREQGVEAYQFHDRNQSIVTVGSFQTVGTKLNNGTFKFDDAILRVLEYYSAEIKTDRSGLPEPRPKAIAGVPYDPQSTPIEVPRYSVSRDYAQTGWFR